MFNRKTTTTYMGKATAGVSIRWTDSDENSDLAAVAARDSQQLPDGPWLVAEVEGSALAVLSLETGSFVADPFSRTVELRALLELRAKQLGKREPSRAHRFGRTRRVRERGAGAPTPQPATFAARPRF